MKIVCDNCATKYSIADEKVRGKVFKIRCKKCSHIIVVRGGADGSVEASSSRDAAPVADGFPAAEEQQTMAARGASAGGGAAATGDAVWHLVIDREQVGPMTPSEVRAKFAEGACDAETYAWREGFGDWLRLGSIEDFRDLGGAPTGDEGSTRRTDSADLFAAAGGSDDSASPSEGAGGDLFGGGGAPSPAFTPAAASASEDVFGNGGGGGGGALFGAPSAAPAPAPRPQRNSSPGFAAQQQAPAEPAGGVDVRPMTGQRNENSVLFSLNNLQALATGGGGAKAAPSSQQQSSSGNNEQRPGFASSQTEGSGLIDIRAMAASTLSASGPSGPSSSKGGDDLPGLGHAPVFSAMAAPILMPAAPSGPPKWMWAILGVGVAAVLGIVVVGVLLLTHKPDAPAVVAAGTAGAVPAAATPGAAAPAAAAPAAAAPAAAPAAAAATPGAVAANEPKEEGGKGGGKHHGKGVAGGTKLAKNDAPKAESAPPPAAAAPPPVAAAPKKKKGGDELDDLLNGASPGDAPKSHKKAAASDDDSGGGGAAAAPADLPDTLDKQQIVGGMGRIKGRVGACYDQFKVPGMANVSVTIGGAGHVTSANVSGPFAGTPTGECVSRAVKSATFPKFKGAALTISYPFMLR